MVFSSRIFLESGFCFLLCSSFFFFNKISLTFFSKKKKIRGVLKLTKE